MKKNVIYLILLIFIIGCGKKISGTGNFRSFKFTYRIQLEPSINKKLELWVPIPQSNNAQSISNLTIDTQGLNYELRDEDYHGNKYLYIYSNDKHPHSANNPSILNFNN